ncbi:MAG TPA: type II secretion system F family protein [Actinomycetota bacterium]|nr:type II secretion system F family protein [Actinomycetota bacterium]
MSGLLALLSGGTVLLAFLSVDRRDPVVAAQIAALSGSSVAARHFRPVAALLQRLGRAFPGSAADATRDLLAAAARSHIPTEQFRGTQLALAAVGLSFGFASGGAALLVAPICALVGFRLPRTVLTSRIRRRKDEMAAALPDVVDLMAVCTHAGLNISLSLRRVAERASGPMAREMQRTVEEIDLGIPRSQALQNLAARNGLPELESLVRVLLHSERFGSQISSSLETFSAEVRANRKRSAEEQARKAPVKILFPLVFLILPAFILLSVVPLLMSAFQALEF